LALDEPKDNDDTFDVKGYKFLVDKNLMRAVAPITVDMVNGYFNVISSMQPAAGGGECGGCTSC
jgi:iron-sulfur cluster assembly protein